MTGHLTPSCWPARPRRCSTTTSTAGCGRRPSIELAGEYGYHGPADDRRRRAGALVQPRRQAQRPRAVPGDVRPHRRRDAAPGRHRAGGLRVRPGPRRRRRRLRRGAHGAGAVHRGRADARRGDAGDPRRLRQGLGRDRPDDLRHRHGDAHGGAQPGDRRAGRALAGRRGRRVRHRRRRGRLPADAPPRRVPVRDAGQLPHDDPRRRGVRAAERSGRPCSGAAPSGSATACASSTTSAGPIGNEQLGRLAAYIRDTRIPLELCPTSNVNTGVVRSIAEHPIEMLRRLRFRVTVNTDNRLMSDTSMTKELVQLQRCVRVDDRRLRVGDDQHGEERVRPVPGAAADHQRRDQAALRAAQGRDGVRRMTSRRSRRARRHVVTVVDHPLVADALAQIRDRTTPNALFRQNLERIGTLLMARATEDLPTVDTTVETPLTTAPARRLAVQPVVVPILRAGLGFVHAAQELLPDADVGFIGISRDEETFAPKPYVNKLPESLAGRPVIVVDPMLATGGSLVHTIELLLERDAPTPITVGVRPLRPRGHRAAARRRPRTPRRHRRRRRPPQRLRLHRPRPRRRRRPPVRPPRLRSPVLTPRSGVTSDTELAERTSSAPT